MELLRTRQEVPKIIVRNPQNEQRLVILPSEDSDESTAIGRPIAGNQKHPPPNPIQKLKTK